MKKICLILFLISSTVYATPSGKVQIKKVSDTNWICDLYVGNNKVESRYTHTLSATNSYDEELVEIYRYIAKEYVTDEKNKQAKRKIGNKQGTDLAPYIQELENEG